MKMTSSEIGRLGAEATNRLLTPEKRSKAAKKGWITRRKNLKAKKKQNDNKNG